MKKAVIFDLDGTVLDTLETIAYYVNLTMKKNGLKTLPTEDYNYLLGNSSRYLIKETLKRVSEKELSSEEKERILEEYNTTYNDNPLRSTKPYEGVVDVLKAMKEKGLKVGVFSNKPHPTCVKVTEQIFGAGFFDGIQGQKDSIPRKPNPQGLFAMMEDFGVSPEETIYIGDTEVDLETGERAGVDTYFVHWGFRKPEDVKDMKRKGDFYKPLEMMKLLES